MLYFRLFHGRIDPEQDLNDWGSDGPVLGPYDFVHTTYAHHIIFGKPNDDSHELFVVEDMLYYDGVYYGDWSVFDEQTLNDGKYKTTTFEQSKAALPPKHE